jgi:hypothetical protein
MAESDPGSADLEIRRKGLAPFSRRLIATLALGIAIAAALTFWLRGSANLDSGRFPRGSPEEKLVAKRLIKKAFAVEESEKRNEKDRLTKESSARTAGVSGSTKLVFMVAVQRASENGVKGLTPDELAMLKRYAPEYLESRAALERLQKEGIDALNEHDRSLILQYTGDDVILRKEASASALKDPLWTEFAELVSLTRDDAAKFGLLTAPDRKRATELVRQATGDGVTALSVDDVRLLIRAGADKYLKREAGE